MERKEIEGERQRDRERERYRVILFTSFVLTNTEDMCLGFLLDLPAYLCALLLFAVSRFRSQTKHAVMRGGFLPTRSLSHSNDDVRAVAKRTPRFATSRRILRNPQRRSNKVMASSSSSSGKNANLGIERRELEDYVDPKYSAVTIHNGTAYFAGQAELGDGIREQTLNTLAECDRVLKLAGTDKNHILSVMCWLKDMSDYKAFNEVYLDWIEKEHKPVRACVKSEMALPEYLVEIQMIAAVPPS
jgi:enamine deaminase RidA (YjgF/YER057c/UK114 family)